MIIPVEDALLDLVKTYSPTGEEGEAVEKFCGYLDSLQASEIHKDNAGNAIGKFSGSGISVVLCGHIDTVPGELPIKLEKERLYGRGAVDAKASLIALLYGAKSAKERGFKGDLSVIAAVGEEGPGKGIVEVASSHPRSDYAILGEPSGTTGITAGYRGRLLIDAAFNSKSHHASAPWMGNNAVDIAIDSWQKIKEKYGSGKDFSKVSVALTSIHGGEADNVTPASSSITLDVRFPPSRKGEEVLQEIRRSVESEYGESVEHIKVRSRVDPYVSNLKTPLVKSFKESIGSFSGEKAKMIFKSGSGDMNLLGSSWGIPCITYGPGNTQLAHTDDEVISLEEVRASVNIVSDALLLLEKIHEEGT